MHSAKFEPFIDGADMSEFCRREVEPMGVECDHVQIAALTEFLSIRVNIMYLDNRLRSDAYSDPVVVEFPQVQEDGAHSDIISCFPPVNLLYRPGHYDILYYSK